MPKFVKNMVCSHFHNLSQAHVGQSHQHQTLPRRYRDSLICIPCRTYKSSAWKRKITHFYPSLYALTYFMYYVIIKHSLCNMKRFLVYHQNVSPMSFVNQSTSKARINSTYIITREAPSSPPVFATIHVTII
jgi:hypothetical protein